MYTETNNGRFQMQNALKYHRSKKTVWQKVVFIGCRYLHIWNKKIFRFAIIQMSSVMFLTAGGGLHYLRPYFQTYPWYVMTLKREFKLKFRLPFVI